MLYAALTFWLFVILVVAWGVHQTWCSMIRPKVFNAVLLPGTLVAQLGHALGLLLAGGRIGDAIMSGDNGDGTGGHPKMKLATLGPVILGLLPFIACTAAIYLLAILLGGHVMGHFKSGAAGTELPTTMTEVWALLHAQITLVESTVTAIASIDSGDWRTWVFVYFAVCLAVQIAPFQGNLRGALIAMIVLGMTWASLGYLVSAINPMGHQVWEVMNLILGTLLLLLFVALVLRGGVGLARIFRPTTK
jgi:hypothetical protein